MNQKTFACGHPGQVPDRGSMGRGAARERRIAAYFDRLCLGCATKAVEAEVARLTRIDGSPLPADVRHRKAVERIAKVRKSYFKFGVRP